MNDYIETDVLIIGAGIAGSIAALSLGERGIDTLLVSKGKDWRETNTYQAQGGIANLFDETDPADFIDDIIKSGDNINKREAVEQVVNMSTDLVNDILINRLKIPFSRKNGKFDLAQEGAHSHRRILNVKDMTGKYIQDCLYDYLKGLKSVRFLFKHTAVDILTRHHHSDDPFAVYDEPMAVGAYVLNSETGKIIRVFARRILLATGGAGSIFLHSTNPDDAVGNGIAIAHRAGARIGNMEYIQFHPTSLYNKDARGFLISEAVRGEGAKLLNRKGEAFMENYSPMKDLAPRDEVSRAIYEEMIKNGDDYVLLDLASNTDINIPDRFPAIYKECRKHGIEIDKRAIPVVPAAHYSCGGIMTDLNGRSSLKNLYAVGEVACTGVHGANRLASVSLLEGLVWGYKAAEDIAEELKKSEKMCSVSEISGWKYPDVQEELDPALVLQDQVTVKYTMWNYSGIIRTVKRLERAKSDLEYLRHRILRFYHKTEITNSMLDLRDSVQTALLIVYGALHNRVSRGAHYIRK